MVTLYQPNYLCRYGSTATRAEWYHNKKDNNNNERNICCSSISYRPRVRIDVVDGELDTILQAKRKALNISDKLFPLLGAHTGNAFKIVQHLSNRRWCEAAFIDGRHHHHHCRLCVRPPESDLEPSGWWLGIATSLWKKVEQWLRTPFAFAYSNHSTPQLCAPAVTWCHKYLTGSRKAIHPSVKDNTM